MHTLFLTARDPATLPAPVRDRYRVDATHVRQGPPTALPVPGDILVRLETPEAAVLSSPVQYGGSAGSARYTDPAAPTAAANGLGPLPPPCRAVLIPLRKSQAWWDMEEASRRAYFHSSPTHPNHTETGAPYIRQIHRRLFHSRAATAAYDFLTYFEFHPKDETAFRQLLSGLRDTGRNPEWKYIDREWEIWMTKLP